MFEVFQSERGSARPWHRRDLLALSAGLHVLLVLGATRIPVGTPAPLLESIPEETVTFVEILRKQPTPPAPAPVPAPRPVAARAPGEVDESPPPRPRPRPAAPPPARLLGTPLQLPPVTPKPLVASSLQPVGSERPSPLATGPVAWAGSGPPGTAADSAGDGGGEGGPAGGGGGTSDEPLELSMVAERPILRNAEQVRRMWKRLYPRGMNSRNIEGDAVISFVVDTRGRVEPESAVLIRASHPDFGQATLKGVDDLRFRPARLNGRPVRVRVELPVLWRLADFK